MPKGKKPPAEPEKPPTYHHVKQAPKVAPPAPTHIPIPDEGSNLKPKKGMKFKKVLAPKKEVKEGEWALVEKRDAYLVEKPIHSDSDNEDGSELSD